MELEVRTSHEENNHSLEWKIIGNLRFGFCKNRKFQYLNILSSYIVAPFSNSRTCPEMIKLSLFFKDRLRCSVLLRLFFQELAKPYMMDLCYVCFFYLFFNLLSCFISTFLRVCFYAIVCLMNCIFFHIQPCGLTYGQTFYLQFKLHNILVHALGSNFQAYASVTVYDIFHLQLLCIYCRFAKVGSG